MNTSLNAFNDAQAACAISTSFPSTLSLIRKSFNVLSLITLLLIGFSSTTVKADNHLGGFIVMVQGLTDEDIVVEFDAQKSGNPKSGYKNSMVHLTILASDGTLVYQVESTSTLVDLSSIALQTGDYVMYVEVEQGIETIAFSYQ